MPNYRAQKQITMSESLFASILYMLQYEVSSISDPIIWKKNMTKVSYFQGVAAHQYVLCSKLALLTLSCSNLLLISHKVDFEN